MQIALVPFLDLCTKASYINLCRIHIHYDIWIYILFSSNFWGKKSEYKIDISESAIIADFLHPCLAFYPLKFEDFNKCRNSTFHNLVNSFYGLKCFK